MLCGIFRPQLLESVSSATAALMVNQLSSVYQLGGPDGSDVEKACVCFFTEKRKQDVESMFSHQTQQHETPFYSNDNTNSVCVQGLGGHGSKSFIRI